ncbi:hypothetical protein ACFL33_05510 [Pseudomonadota bacterium]|jgi:hypothetical protein|nr:hypothetical protein [Xanthomonadales bacterium]
MLCVVGNGRVIVDDRENHQQPCELLIIPRNRSHKDWAEDDGPWSRF